MTVERRWAMPEPPSPQAREALTAFPRTLQQILVNRGIETSDAADVFLRPDERLGGNPNDIPDMDAAIHRIRQAMFAGEKIGVYGDFDSDGITGTVLLTEALRNLGLTVTPYIPSRSEGHGVNRAALETLLDDGCTLVITADCGVGGINDGAAPPRGMDVIVTDHHMPRDMLPDFTAIVNPMRRESAYPSPKLAGVGVAYKLAQGLHQALDKDLPDGLLELVALGTVADVAPLIDENRYLVSEGLIRMRDTRRPGIRILASIAHRPLAGLTSEDIAFQIAPRLNAPGRLSHADDALRLLSTMDEEEARTLAVRLDELNQRRRELTETAYNKVREQMTDDDTEAPIIVAGAPDIPAGILGLVAGRLMEEFYRPSFVYSIDDDGLIHGSARSIEEFDADAALKQCSDLLTQFGGHHRAAGFSALESNLSAFRDRLRDLAARTLDGVDLHPVIAIDAEGAPTRIAAELNSHMAKLEPFGEGNRKPVFLAGNMRVISSRRVGDGSHLRLSLAEPDTGREWNAIAFRQGGKAGQARGEIDVAFQFQENDGGPNANRPPTLELNVQDFRPSA